MNKLEGSGIKTEYDPASQENKGTHKECFLDPLIFLEKVKIVSSDGNAQIIYKSKRIFLKLIKMVQISSSQIYDHNKWRKEIPEAIYLESSHTYHAPWL
jgi:hypothetical protein